MMDEALARALVDSGYMPPAEFYVMHAKKDEVPPPTADPIGFAFADLRQRVANITDALASASELAALKAENQRLREWVKDIAEYITDIQVPSDNLGLLVKMAVVKGACVEALKDTQP